MNRHAPVLVAIFMFYAINMLSCGSDDPASSNSGTSGTNTSGTTQTNTSATTPFSVNTQTVDPATAPVPTSPYANGNTTAVGSDPVSDGSAARLQAYGQEQYFWGDPGTGTQIPLVKIVTATTSEVTDVALVFNPVFTELTYGEASAVNGWNPKRPHTYRDIYVSDHVEVAFTNGAGDTVLHVRLDLLSPTTLVSSGYASLGVTGGDGAVIKGDPAWILSFGTTADDNINVCGWTNELSSPPTDSIYSPNPISTCYQYLAAYRLAIDPAAFGPSGYGTAYMTSVHASPAKTPQETIPVNEGPPPPTNEPDPFTPGSDEPNPNLPDAPDSTGTGGDEPGPSPSDSSGTGGGEPPPTGSDSTATDSTITGGNEPAPTLDTVDIGI